MLRAWLTPARSYSQHCKTRRFNIHWSQPPLCSFSNPIFTGHHFSAKKTIAVKENCKASPMCCRSNFNPAGTFGGMIALATEVAGKKISSEEETFSDLSILIFHNNFLVRWQCHALTVAETRPECYYVQCCCIFHT